MSEDRNEQLVDRAEEIQEEVAPRVELEGGYGEPDVAPDEDSSQD